MKKRKSRSLKKYVSAVGNVVKEELSSFEYVPEEIDKNQDLLWDIKEMLEHALVGAYLAPPPKDLQQTDPKVTTPLRHPEAYVALCAAWHAANDLKIAWANAPITAQRQFVADVLGIVDRR